MRIHRCSATVTVVAITSLLFGQASRASTADTVNPVSDSTSNTGEVTIAHDELIRLPFRTIEEVIGLQNGTTLYYQKPGGDFSLTVPQISVQGSQPFETGYYLNGIQMNDPFSGYFTARISPHALDYLTLDPASFGAQHGFSGASAVQMTTRRGGSRFSGMVESVSDNALGSGFDQNWYTTSLGGPIPGVHNANFFGLVERRYFGDRNPSIMTDNFLPGNPDRLPGNWLDGWSYNGRLDYEPIENLSITTTLDGSTTEWSEYIHAFYFDSIHVPYYNDENLAFSGRVRHRLTPTLEYSVQASYFRSERFRGDGVYREHLDSYPKDDDNQETDYDRLFWAWDDMFGPSPDSNKAYVWDNYLRHKSSETRIAGSISKLVAHDHEFTLSGDYRRYAIRVYENLNPTSSYGYRAGYVFHYGYDLSGNEADDGGTTWGNSVRHPSEVSFRLSDRMRFGGTVLVPCLEYKLFDLAATPLKDPEQPLYPGGDLPHTYKGYFKEPQSHARWSPSIAVLHTVDRRIGLYACFGITYLRPDFRRLYSDWSYFFVRVWRPDTPLLPSEGLEPVRTQHVGFGMSIEPQRWLRFRVDVFQRQTDNAPALVYQEAEPESYFTYRCLDRDVTQGVSLSASVNPLKNLSLQSLYTYSRTDTEAAWMSNFRYRPWQGQYARLTATQPWDFDQRQSLALAVSWRTGDGSGPRLLGSHLFANLQFDLTYQSSSGAAYTPTNANNPLELLYYVRGFPVSVDLSSRFPGTTCVDMKLEKALHFAGVEVLPFVWISNLFDAENISYVYPCTGQPDNTGYLQTDEGIARIESGPEPTDNTGMNFEQKYQFAQHDPLNYGPPRQILFGLRVIF